MLVSMNRAPFLFEYFQIAKYVSDNSLRSDLHNFAEDLKC